MTETKAELLGRSGSISDVSGAPDAAAVRAERQSIGKQLHQGILQELTVAGLRLRLLEDTAPPPTAAAIGEFSAWLRDRQAELRQMVSRLEQGEPGGTPDLAAIVAELNGRYGCQVSIDPQFRPDRFEPDIWSAMTGTAHSIVRLLAESLSASHIAITMGGTRPSLQISHDGEFLADHADRLEMVRALVGRGGASLAIARQATTERLTLDWTS